MSARKATHLPSGEISARSSVPCQSVKRENVALARGSAVRRGHWGRRRFPHDHDTRRRAPGAPPTVAMSARHAAKVPSRTSEPGSASSSASISIRTSPISLRRCFGFLARQRKQDPSYRHGGRGGQRRPVRLALENLRDRVRGGVASKRDAPGQHLVEHASEGPDVGALVDRRGRAPARDSCRRPCP